MQEAMAGDTAATERIPRGLPRGLPRASPGELSPLAARLANGMLLVLPPLLPPLVRMPLLSLPPPLLSPPSPLLAPPSWPPTVTFSEERRSRRSTFCSWSIDLAAYRQRLRAPFRLERIIAS